MQKQFIFLLPILSGAFLALILPPQNMWLLSFVALVPLLFFVNSKKTSTKQAFWGGTLAGFIYFFTLTYPFASLDAWWWISENMGFLWKNKAYFLLLLLIALSFYGGVFMGIFTALYKKFHRSNITDAIVFPAIWIIFEYIREFTLLGFTWGHLGYTLHSDIYALQLAKPFGLYGLSFFIVSINILLFIAIKKRYDFKKNTALFILVVALLLVHVYGYFSIKNSYATDKRSFDVAVIHPNVATEKSLGITGYKYLKEMLVEATAENPDIIVMPENAFPSLVIDENTHLPVLYNQAEKKEMYDGLIKLSQENEATSFVAGFHTEIKGERYNSIVVFENGTVADIYHKRFLLPFAEYVPEIFKDRINLFEPLKKGQGVQNIIIKDTEVTPLICSEVIFPGLSQTKTGKFIINASNDSIFKSEVVGMQHHIMAKMRAVENSAYIVRSVKGGVSSIIDPFGREVAKAQVDEKNILFETISF